MVRFGKITMLAENTRVATRLIYIPAHTNASGRKINCKVKFTIAVNTVIPSKNNVEYCRIIAFGGIAEYCCKHLSKGRLLKTIIADQKTFTMSLKKDGVEVIDPKTNKQIIVEYKDYVLVKKPILGEETKAQIEEDILNGIRPKEWNNPAHSDYNVWKEILKIRNTVKYVEGKKTFGYAIIY